MIIWLGLANTIWMDVICISCSKQFLTPCHSSGQNPGSSVHHPKPWIEGGMELSPQVTWGGHGKWMKISFWLNSLWVLYCWFLKHNLSYPDWRSRGYLETRHSCSETLKYGALAWPSNCLIGGKKNDQLCKGKTFGQKKKKWSVVTWGKKSCILWTPEFKRTNHEKEFSTSESI